MQKATKTPSGDKSLHPRAYAASNKSVIEKANRGREHLQEVWDTFNKIKYTAEFEQAISMIRRNYEKQYLK